MHFCGEQMDIMVTPNHRMLTKLKDEEWKVVFADQVRPGMKFLAHGEFKHSNDFPPAMTIPSS